MSLDLNKFLETAVQEFENGEKIVEGQIPPDLNPLLRESVLDASFREKYGLNESTWQAISKCFEHANRLAGEGYKRYLNGIILIARGLICAPGAGLLAWSNKTGNLAIEELRRILLIQKEMSQWDVKLLNSILQFLANFSSEIASSFTSAAPPMPLFEKLLNSLDNDSTRALCRELASDDANSKALLVFLETYIKQDSTRLDHLLPRQNETPGYTILLTILAHTERWFSEDSQNESHAVMLNQITRHIISSGYGSLFLESLSEENMTTDQYLSLLKLFDAAIPACIEDQELTLDNQSKLTVSYINHLEKASIKAMPFITAADTSPEYSQQLQVEISNIWNGLVVVLDSIQTLIEGGKDQDSVKKCILSPERGIVKTLVELIGNAQSHLPQRNKLADVSKEEHGPPQEFPLIKGKIISILSLLTMHNKQVQDEIRERHGLEVVLSNCIIDLNNPFIRERAILCIRYLLENNPENQAIVAALEAKKPVSEQEIEKAGYETEIVNGQLALKKAKK